jgi:PKD repeat protein
MISRFRGPARLALFTLVVTPMVACERVPLLAPSNSTITLTTSTTALAINGTTQIIAQVIEAAGVPPHSGTHVTFTTTLGSVQPSDAQTDANGQAVAIFNAGSASGTATISAISGGSSVAANGVLKILVGTAAVGRVTLNATPSLVPALGGSSTISAQVYDVNGNALNAAPVSFSTTAGTLSSTLVVTDRNGAAQVVLNTSTQAVVTASVGATATSGGGGGGTGGGGGGGAGGGTTPAATGTASASVTVGVAGSPTLVINPPATAPSAGLAAVFTFAITAAATNPTPVKDVAVNWGDRSPVQDLGAISGSTAVAHVFASPGTYTIVATVTDAFGNVITPSTSVTVNPKPQPIVTLAVTTTNPTSGTDVAFTGSVAIAANSNTVIQDVTVNFGDGTVTDLGAATGTAISLHHAYAMGGTYTVTLTATDSNGGIGTAVTTVFVQTSAPLAVSLTATTTPSGANTTVAFTATVIGLGNDVVVNYHWVFGSTLGVADTTSNQVTRTYAAGTGTVTPSVTVTTSRGNTATGSTVIIIP